MKFCHIPSEKSSWNITLSPKITTIEPSTFEGCSSLQHVNGMISIDAIKDRAFAYCTLLQSIDVKKSIAKTAFLEGRGHPLKSDTDYGEDGLNQNLIAKVFAQYISS